MPWQLVSLEGEHEEVEMGLAQWLGQAELAGLDRVTWGLGVLKIDLTTNDVSVVHTLGTAHTLNIHA